MCSLQAGYPSHAWFVFDGEGPCFAGLNKMSSNTTSHTPWILIAANEVLVQFTRLHHATSSSFSCSKTHDHIRYFYVPGKPLQTVTVLYSLHSLTFRYMLYQYLIVWVMTPHPHCLYIVWALKPCSSPSNLSLLFFVFINSLAGKLLSNLVAPMAIWLYLSLQHIMIKNIIQSSKGLHISSNQYHALCTSKPAVRT